MAPITQERQALILQRIVVAGSGAWAASIVLISLGTFGHVNADARLLVGSATLLAAAAAVAASWLASRTRFRWAAVALLVSVIAPTYFLWVVNIVPLLLAVTAVMAAIRTIPQGAGTEG